MELTFGKISKIADKGVDFNKIFKTVYEDDGKFVAVSRETFSHEEEGMNFKYKYAIEQLDFDEAFEMGAFGEDFYKGNEGKVETLISIFPVSESIKDDLLEDIASCNGIDTDGVYDFDIYDYGMNLLFDKDTSKKNLADSKLLALANCFEIFEGLFGFFMDKNQNAAGQDGWDYIRQWTKN